MRLEELVHICRRRRLDQIIVSQAPNVQALTGVACDNAVLWLKPGVRRPAAVFHTDFRYVPMVHRVAPDLQVRDIRRLRLEGRRIGCEFTLPHARVQELQKLAPRATFVDISADLAKIRAVKTPEEQAKIRSAEKLDCAIWRAASARFRAGMTEREMARIIRRMMIDRGDGEAFDTIVCVGKNAAECHHVPDDTVWDGREPVLVDMGVKLDGFCSDLTRNICPKRPSRAYREVYGLVQKANCAAIAAARPGITAKALDKVARDVIKKGGFGKCFGHSTGHGVGLEIHEAPTVSGRNATVLKAGMVVTIEPGIYLEGNLGVRIEDMILITESGCEVLSS